MLIFSLKRKTVNFVQATKQLQLLRKEALRQQPSWLDRSTQKSSSAADATRERSLKAALGPLLLLEPTGGTRNQTHLQNAKKQQNSTTCKASTQCKSQEDLLQAGGHRGALRGDLWLPYWTCKAYSPQASAKLPRATKGYHARFSCRRIKSFFGSRAWGGKRPRDHHPAMHIGCFSSSSSLSLGPEHPLARDGAEARRRSRWHAAGQEETQPSPGLWPRQSF